MSRLVVLVIDEYYPFYTLDKPVYEYQKKSAVKVTAGFYKKYQKIMNDFNKMQNELYELNRHG